MRYISWDWSNGTIAFFRELEILPEGGREIHAKARADSAWAFVLNKPYISWIIAHLGQL